MKLKSIYNSIVKEDAATDNAVSSIQKVFKKGERVSTSQAQLSQIIKEPKVAAVLNAGLFDGNLKDDKFPYKRVVAKVGNLQPTQSEIGFDQSVMNLLTDQYNSIESFFKGRANVGGPIVTYDNKYIIDGHHRWSQVFAANPNATMVALNIVAKPGYDPSDILTVVHAAIAASLGKVPEANPKGINLLDGVSLSQVQKAVDANLTPAAEAIWKKYSPVPYGKTDTIEINGPEDIAEAITKNLELMIKQGVAPGAVGRKFMPQTDADGGNPIDHLGNLQRGQINVDMPYAPTQTESLREKFTRIARLRKYGNS
jgi:hypothetical protein